MSRRRCAHLLCRGRARNLQGLITKPGRRLAGWECQKGSRTTREPVLLCDLAGRGVAAGKVHVGIVAPHPVDAPQRYVEYGYSD